MAAPTAASRPSRDGLFAVTGSAVFAFTIISTMEQRPCAAYSDRSMLQTVQQELSLGSLLLTGLWVVMAVVGRMCMPLPVSLSWL